MKRTTNPIQLLVSGYDSIQWGKHLLELMKAAEKAKSTYQFLRTGDSYEKWQRIEKAFNDYPDRPEEYKYVKV